MCERHDTVVVDSIHGDIHLTEREHRVIDTASFQRLRKIKHLGMAHLTYPNATHTRFAHSLGVFAIMCKILRLAKSKGLFPDDSTCENLRLAALLHDVGHYPYSHLMERLENSQLMEGIVEDVDTQRNLNAEVNPYPKHEEVGRLVLEHKNDLIEAIGSQERAQRIADLFCRSSAEDLQLSKLINSSLDMDRLDYLLRDSNACGVPYGQIDINYLLNNLEISPTGLVGFSKKALPALEQFLWARYFMYRAVYFHKTTFGFEEACRQLLLRLRGAQQFDILPDGNAVADMVRGDEFGEFTDAYIDRLVQRASTDSDDSVIRALAQALQTRRPPCLLKEVFVLKKRGDDRHQGALFRNNVRHRLKQLSENHGLPIGRFMFCETKPLSLEKRGGVLTTNQARNIEPEESDELVKVFVGDTDEPQSIVDIEHSVIGLYANHVFQMFRLYFVLDDSRESSVVDQLRHSVRGWDSS